MAAPEPPNKPTEEAIQTAIVSTWTPSERSDILTAIDEQLKNSDELERYNHTWLVVLLISAAIVNTIVAISTATANSENLQFQPYKPWFLWGASVLSIIAGLLVSLPKMTNLEGEKEFYHTKSSRCRVLRNQVKLNLITKEAANKSLQEIIELTIKG